MAADDIPASGPKHSFETDIVVEPQGDDSTDDHVMLYHNHDTEIKTVLILVGAWWGTYNGSFG